MTNPKKAKNPLSQGRLNVRSVFFEETMKIVAGLMAEQGIQFLSEDTTKKLARVIPERLLHDNDARLRWAGMLGIALGALGIETAKREAVENFFVQAAEEVGKISNKIDVDDHEGGRKAIRGAVEAKKGGLLVALKGGKEQGDKVQKRALPDYFTAKAAVKDDSLREVLTKIEAELKRKDADMFERFMRKGAFRIQTTPEELIDIAKGSKTDLGYGVDRLKSLMNGQRGEGGIKAKAKAFAEDLLDDALAGDGIDGAAERLSERLTDSIDRAKEQRKRLKRGI